MKNKILIIIVNFICFFILLFILDFGIYKYYLLFNSDGLESVKYGYNFAPKFPKYYNNFENYFNKNYLNENNESFRIYGKEYTKKPPIILFGCSFAYGYGLKYNQTFGYKLSRKLKRTVYNRAIVAGAMNQMYLQTLSDGLYKQIPYSDTVIYIMMPDHYRRVKTDYFYPLINEINPTFKIKYNKLIMKDYNNKLKNFIKSLYIVKHINEKYYRSYVLKDKNFREITDETVLYFVMSKQEMEKHYGNKLKFYIIIYGHRMDEMPYYDMLKEKLQDKGFVCISIEDLTDKYIDSYGHPGEKDWDVIVPLFIKKVGLDK